MNKKGLLLANFFISYNSVDADAADNIANALIDAGFSIRFDRREIGLGDDVALWMTEALDDCDRLIALCSPEYLKPKAKYSAIERAAMLWSDIDGRRAAVIPVIIRACKLPRIIATRSYYDLSKGSLAEFVERLKFKPGRPKNGSGEENPPQRRKGLHFGVPPLERAVVGRGDDLKKLRAGLLDTGEAAIFSSKAVVKGGGGIGKSTLARYYVEEFGAGYGGIFWGVAQSEGQLAQALTALAPALEVNIAGMAPLAAAQAVVSAVTQDRRDWLFVYDNASDYAAIQNLLPDCHLIVTTREFSGWDGFARLDTQALGFDTEDAPAVALLMEVAERDDDGAAAQALAAALGGLPLALVMAGALVREEGFGFADYLSRITDVIARAPKNQAYADSVIGAVTLSYERLSADAKMVVDIFAWWDADSLTPDLLTGAPAGTYWDDYKGNIVTEVIALVTDAGRVRAAVQELCDACLLRRTGSADGPHALHRMPAAALRALQLERGAAEAGVAAVELLATVYPYDFGSSENWPLCRRLTRHVAALWASSAPPETAAMDFLLNQAGGFLQTMGDYPGGLKMAQASLRLTEARLPENDPSIAVALANLGMAQMQVGDLAAAEVELARAVALNEAHRAGSADLASSYDMHGNVLDKMARAGDRTALPKAIRRYQQALTLRRRLFGGLSEEVALSLNNLAMARDLQGRVAAGTRLMRASLSILRNVLPPGDARLANVLVNTGSFLLEAGRTATAAEPLLQEALAIWRAAYVVEPQHPELRIAAGWLISCLLVLAVAEEDAARRRVEARALADEFGFDWAECEAKAAQYPYDPKAGT